MKRTIRVRIAGRNPELSGFLRFLGFLILLFLMLSRLGTAFPAEAATSSPSAYTYEDWKHSLDRVAENLEKDGFHYSVNGGKGSYRKSKEKRRVTNCAIYVSWALQDAGIIKKGQVFWIDKGGAIRGKRKTCITKNNKLKILHPHKKAKHAGLKKGDICGWDSHIHTAVYAGRDAKGRTLWYSAGRDGGVKKNGKWYFKAGKTKAKVRAARYDGKIATVIRIRNLKAAPAQKPKKAKAKSKPAAAAKADNVDEEILNHPDEPSGVEFEEIIPEESTENVISGGETSEEPRDFETEENEPEDAEDATVDDSANDTILDLDKNEVISVKDGTRKKIQDGYGESRDSEDRETKDRDTKVRDTKSRKTKGEINNVRRIDTPETGDDGFAVTMVLLILSCSGLLLIAHRRNPES
ncbi:MAG: hypothetical protein JNG50_00035 [Mogibacterium sp.]|uniref:hypothetical protein n=1 Tax=Mogibacterium sp. TaxID=2049035 RepID=UPI001A4E9EFB|nr:hypothetical protein [Mogibacterium sp.]MBL6467871.1 hypothetical protein [Mogibacterium sp.]